MTTEELLEKVQSLEDVSIKLTEASKEKEATTAKYQELYKQYSAMVEELKDKLYRAVVIDCPYCGYPLEILFTEGNFGPRRWSAKCDNCLARLPSKNTLEDLLQLISTLELAIGEEKC